jgi:hypothetical protein
MTQRLEEVLNLSTQVPTLAPPAVRKPNKRARELAEFDQIATALPHAAGLGAGADMDLDEIASRALNAYDELMEMGMNTEPRYAASIFNVAATMLRHAKDARESKINKKLKIVELQLRKERQDYEMTSTEPDMNIAGEGYVVTDRNSLLAKIKTIS